MISRKALRIALSADDDASSRQRSLGFGHPRQSGKFRCAFRNPVGTEIQPENARTFYHLARAYALAKENRKALAALQTAAEKGFVDLEALAGNEFVGLRNEKRFNEINEIVRNNRAAAENKRKLGSKI